MFLDLYLFQEINKFANKWLLLDILGIFFAKYSGYILVVLLFSFFLLKNKNNYRVMFVQAICSAILSRLFIVEIIRFIYFRNRPFVDWPVNLVLKHEASASFPSGHASLYFAIAFTIFFFNKKIGCVFLITSFLIGLARIFVGVHYPLDILAGIAIGLFSAWIGNKYLRKYIYTLNKKIFALGKEN